MFILIAIILIFIMLYRSSTGDGVYKFVKQTADTAYEKYAGIVTFDRTEDFVTIALTDKSYGLSVRCVKGKVE